jgi:hypothetical protein
MMTQKVPQPGDYAPHYAKYVELVPEGDLTESLVTQLHDFRELFLPLKEAHADFRYAPDKWSIKESLGHVTDTERIFSYRALRFARADQTPLASFEQDDYVRSGNFPARKLPDLLDEFTTVRRATIALVRSLDDAAWLRRGVASGKEVSVLALAFIIVGHVRHHQRIFEERYLPNMHAT